MLRVCLRVRELSRVSSTYTHTTFLLFYLYTFIRALMLTTQAISEHSHWNEINVKHMAVPFAPVRICHSWMKLWTTFLCWQRRKRRRRIAMPFRYQEQDFSTHYIFLLQVYAVWVSVRPTHNIKKNWIGLQSWKIICSFLTQFNTQPSLTSRVLDVVVKNDTMPEKFLW